MKNKKPQQSHSSCITEKNQNQITGHDVPVRKEQGQLKTEEEEMQRPRILRLCLKFPGLSSFPCDKLTRDPGHSFSAKVLRFGFIWLLEKTVISVKFY